jgi:quercetin dioxygenase-like cupin family protein
MKKMITPLCTLVLVLTVYAILAWASAPKDVTPTLIGRATYEPFKVETDSLVNFEAKAKSYVDMVVRKHDYLPGGSTGWHAHPGPVFINVIQGEVTFYEADDPTCTPHVVSAGQGYVDRGSGHLGRNETDEPAVDVSVILAPVNLPFRDELPAPNPYCGF